MDRFTNILGKWLFPRLPRDVRRRKLNTCFAVLIVSLIVMGGVALTIILTAKNLR